MKVKYTLAALNALVVATNKLSEKSVWHFNTLVRNLVRDG